MHHCNKGIPVLTIGMDLGDKKSRRCAVDAKGNVIEEGVLESTPRAFRRFFITVPPARVAIEAGSHSAWVSRVLESVGHEVIVANPRKLRLIYENDQKNDRVDAMYLARVARLDPQLLSPVKHRSEEAQQDLAVLRARMALMKARSSLINHVRSTVKVFGKRLASVDADYFAPRFKPLIPKGLREALYPLFDQMEHLTEQIREFDKKIDKLCEEKYPETKRLRQPKGVGPLTALAFVLTLEDPSRFPRSRDVGAYVGLIPRQNTSGKSNPQLRITKAGNSYLRQLLVTSAHYILGCRGPDCDLKRYGGRIAERGGKNAKKRAVVAVARKLAVVLHALWQSGRDYEPVRDLAARLAA